ncbi:MAG: monovalent cation/H(+) antiporter subunit G [Amaricoccus sp.]|uniref:monovalent cation/H(+) antiporter subunit G n=1 Tax=Amaricoccus sp. TaxID=1872485 RepID=UPI0033152466
MNPVADLPLWAAILVAFLVVLGAGLTLIGSIGLVRLGTFFERIHAPTLGTSWGTGAIVSASVIAFTVAEGRPVLHELFIGLFVTITTPVTLMLLARAAAYRDGAASLGRRAAGQGEPPAGDDPEARPPG